MYVIIVGCGKIGFYLTRALLASSHEVMVIERDAQRGNAAFEEFGSVVLASDGTEPTVLEEAGARRCDLLIATTGSDATNLMASQVAKWSFNVPRTIAVVTDPAHARLFKTLGVDVPLSTTDIILTHIEEEVPGGPLVHLLPVHDSGSGIVTVRVPADSPVIGRSVGTVRVPPGTALAAVIGRHGDIRTLRDDLRLEAGDEIVAITPPEQEDELWETLTGGIA